MGGRFSSLADRGSADVRDGGREREREREPTLISGFDKYFSDGADITHAKIGEKVHLVGRCEILWIISGILKFHLNVGL